MGPREIELVFKLVLLITPLTNSRSQDVGDGRDDHVGRESGENVLATLCQVEVCALIHLPPAEIAVEGVQAATARCDASSSRWTHPAENFPDLVTVVIPDLLREVLILTFVPVRVGLASEYEMDLRHDGRRHVVKVLLLVCSHIVLLSRAPAALCFGGLWEPPCRVTAEADYITYYT